MGFWGKSRGNRHPPQSGKFVKGFNPDFAMRLLFTEGWNLGELPEFGQLFLEEWTSPSPPPELELLFTEYWW